MFLIWGTKTAYEKLGHVAELCPVCRTVRNMEVSRSGTVGHVFFLPLGRTKYTATIAKCPWCEGRFNVDPSVYASIEKGPDWDLRLLIGKTNPPLAELAGKTIADDPKPRDEAIRSTLLRVNRALETREDRQDRPTVVALVSIIAAPVLWGMVASVLPVSEDTRKSLVGLSIVVFIVALVLARMVAKREPHRFFKRRLLPLLIAELAPLQPSPAELKDHLAYLDKNRFAIGKLLNSRALEQAVKSGV